MITLDLQKGASGKGPFQPPIPPKNFDSTLNTEEGGREHNAIKKMRQLVIQRELNKMNFKLPLKKNGNGSRGLKEDQDQFYLYYDRSKAPQPNQVTSLTRPASTNGFMTSHDMDRNLIYDCYMKDSSTKKRLQTIKAMAIENELKFKEKNLMHQLK